jgi:hypothetical protein
MENELEPKEPFLPGDEFLPGEIVEESITIYPGWVERGALSEYFASEDKEPETPQSS